MGGTLLQKQGDEWVVIGYHSKRLLKSAKNFGVTKLELTGLLVNIHGFMQLLHNRYLEVLVDHKANECMIKSKTESPAAKNLTALPQQHPRSLNNEIATRQMINEINAEWEKSDRLTVAKLNAVKQFNKQDHKSKLMTEKYSLLPLNPQQLTPVQTAIQRMSEKHPDFEIEPVNTIQPPEIEYTQMPQALVPIDTVTVTGNA